MKKLYRSRQNEPIKLVEGEVDIKSEHVQLTFGEEEVVALAAPGEDNMFVYQFLIKKSSGNEDIVREVMHELEFYLVNKDEEHPWGYAKYHCTTSANIYSKVHWGYLERGR